MRTPRPDIREVFVRPNTRSLLTFLAGKEEPIRVKAAREALQLSIGELGLARRSLERHGLALSRNLAVEEEAGPRLQHLFIEATDLGREHARILAKAPPVEPPAA